jgi:hypothetical protein
MRVLFMLAHAGLFRNFDSTLRLLVERGHDVHVSFDSDRYPSDAFNTLAARHENLTTGRSPEIRSDRWAALGRHVRAGSDYVRFLDRRYANAPKLRARARRQVPIWLRGLLGNEGRARALDRRLRSIEALLPPSQEVVEFVRASGPDLLVVSPLFGFPAQLEALRAAALLGVANCHMVASWDNLTNKGLMRTCPGTIVVWNEAQLREAVELHGVPRDRVSVTGAQNFDEWFARSPTTGYAEFTARLGLRPDRRYLLYLGSSSFIAPDEASYVAEWLTRLRVHPALADVGVLVRPHPQNARQWERADLREASQVVIHPPPGAAPQQTGRADWSRDDFYDSMYHATAVVGVNTTAMIESGILGKPVHTLLAPQFRHTQEGTLHFEHLRSVNGGLLHVSTDWDEHFASLAGSVERGDEPDPRSRRFVEAFVRPHGLDRSATPLVVDALERAAAQAPEAVAHEVGASRRLLLEPLALLAAGTERWTRRPKRKRGRRLRRTVQRARRLLPRA